MSQCITTTPITTKSKSFIISSSSSSSSSNTNVRVSCRFRPKNRIEEESNSQRVFQVDENCVRYAGEEPFHYDKIFDEDATQTNVYEFCAKPLVNDVLAGYNCTMFAYGQTGSGKTHTMMGPDDMENPDLLGIIPRIAEDVFIAMKNSPANVEFTIKLSFVEIYMEKIRDLLNAREKSQNLKVREDKQSGITVEGCQEVYVSNPKEFLHCAAKGSACRAIASTRMNQDSSRSHSVFMVTVAQKTPHACTTGKLFLVDLAGSEMVGKTGATGSTLEEAKMINRSLSALGNVIKALTENTKHIPYRDSKLTRLLQDALGGNSKTSLVINITGYDYNALETLSTLRFGTRAKKIKNKPKVNQEFTIREYKVIVTDAQKTIHKLGTYARMLENRIGIDASMSPVKESRRSGFKVDGDIVSLPETLSVPPMAIAGSSSKGVTSQANTSSSRQTKNNATADDHELLLQADRALTVSLKIQGNLSAQLEEKTQEFDSLKSELEDMTTEIAVKQEECQALLQKNEKLQEILNVTVKERELLQREVSDLQLFQSSASFEIEDLKIAMKNLETANNAYQQKSAALAKDPSLVSRQSAQQPMNMVEALQHDFEALTANYIALRFEHIETKEILSSMLNDESYSLIEALQHSKKRETELQLSLQESSINCEVAHNEITNSKLKMQNRDKQISFLEETVRDYQDAFRKQVEKDQKYIEQLEQELAHYKLLLDSESTEENYKIVKPVRGESVEDFGYALRS